MMVSNSLQINFLGKNTDQLYIYRDATAYSRSPILESSTRAVHLSTGNIAVQLIFALSVAIIIVTIQARNAVCRKYINVSTLVGLLFSSGFMGILFFCIFLRYYKSFDILHAACLPPSCFRGLTNAYSPVYWCSTKVDINGFHIRGPFTKPGVGSCYV